MTQTNEQKLYSSGWKYDDVLTVLMGVANCDMNYISNNNGRDYEQCPLCGEDDYYTRNIKHEPDCIFLLAKDMLCRHEEEEDEILNS